MRRTRATTTEERELLPLHRPSTSLSMSVGSRPTVPPLSPTSPQLPPPPPPRRRGSSVIAASPTPLATNSGYGYKRRETPHDAALADLNSRLTGGVQTASVNPPQPRSSGGAPSTEHAYHDYSSTTAANPSTGDPPNAQSTSYHRRAARHLSLPPPPRSSSSAPLYEPIYDPYTGQYRGQLVPPHSSRHMSRPQRQPDSPSASTTTSSASSIKTSSSSSASSDKEDDYPVLGPPPDVNLLLSPEEKKREEDMWATLARIRVIQSEVSKKQLSLEAFAVPSAFPKDRATTTASSEEQQQGGATTVSPRGSISRKSGRETVAGGTSDDPGSVKTDKRSSRTAVSGSPTTATGTPAASATQPPPKDAFAQRREAIDEIVKKLDDLSCAVKQLNTHNKPPTSPPAQAAHPSLQPPTLQIPTTRPAGGFGWRSPSTSSYNSFKEQINARNKQRTSAAGTPGAAVNSPVRVSSPPPLQRSTTAPALTVQPPSATSLTTAAAAGAAWPLGYPSAGPQNKNTARILTPGGYSSASSSREDYLSSSRNRQPLLYDSPGEL